MASLRLLLIASFSGAVDPPGLVPFRIFRCVVTKKGKCGRRFVSGAGPWAPRTASLRPEVLHITDVIPLGLVCEHLYM